MSRPASRDAPRFFSSPAEFRAWLERHAASAPELVVGFHKAGSGLPTLTWSEAVDEALCVGWIDGVRTRIDDTAYKIRFTPRRPGSIWSAVNVAKVEKLLAEGRMTSAGLAAFEQRQAQKVAVYSYERAGSADLSAAERQAFQRDAAAWAFFEQAPASYRRMVLHWITGAKQAATRERRLQTLIEACTEGRRLFQYGR